jgi:hypothetical protein
VLERKEMRGTGLAAASTPIERSSRVIVSLVPQNIAPHRSTTTHPGEIRRRHPTHLEQGGLSVARYGRPGK